MFFFFVKIVLKSLFLVVLCVFFTLEGKKFICLLRSTLVLVTLAWNGTQFAFFCTILVKLAGRGFFFITLHFARSLIWQEFYNSQRE